MHRLEEIAAAAQVFALVLGNGATGDFALLPLTGEPLSRPYLERVFGSPRRLRIYGGTGLVNGYPRTVLLQPLEDEDIRGLAELFAKYCPRILTGRIEGTSTAVEGALTACQTAAVAPGDSLDWCEGLYALEDMRPA